MKIICLCDETLQEAEAVTIGNQPQATERIRSLRRGGLDAVVRSTHIGWRFRSCSNARKTYGSAEPRATRSTGQGSVDDTADLKMTEDSPAEDTAASEDTTQDCLAIQAKNLEALANAKIVDLREDRRCGIPGQPVSAVIARKFGKFSSQKRAFDRIGAAHISCRFCDARRDL